MINEKDIEIEEILNEINDLNNLEKTVDINDLLKKLENHDEEKEFIPEYKNQSLVDEYKTKFDFLLSQLKYSFEDFKYKNYEEIIEEIWNKKIDIILHSLLLEWTELTREDVKNFLDIENIENCCEKSNRVNFTNNSLNYIISKIWQEKKIYQNLIRIVRWKFLWEDYSKHMLYSEKDRFIIHSCWDSCHKTPNWSDITDLMNFYEYEINKLEDSWKKAILSYYLIYSIQPFNDWNNRTSRFIMNLILSNWWIWWVILKNEDKKEIFESLEEIFQNNNIQKFEEFIYKQIKN